MGDGLHSPFIFPLLRSAMKNSLLPFVLMLTALLPRAAIAAGAPRYGTTPLDWSVRMADSEMRRLGNTLDAPPKGKGRWDYTTGMYADALIRLSDRTGDPVYEKNAAGIISSFIGLTGRIATYQAKHDRPKKKAGNVHGKPGKASPAPAPTPANGKPEIRYSLDEVQSGLPTLELYDLTGEGQYRRAARILRNQLRTQPRTPEGGFWHKFNYPNQMWLDGLYMGEPFYAAYAVRFDEPRDFDDIANQFLLVGAHTYDPKTGLFYHGWDESKKQPWANRKTGASPRFWSRAIGWYAMALVDVLDSIPADHPARPALIGLFRKIAAGLLKYQDRETGLWWQVTDQGNRTGNYLEATSSCMFVYAMAKGVNHGYLPRSDVPAIRAGYHGIIRKFVTVDPDGKSINLTRCCQVAGLDAKNKATYKYYTTVPHIVSNDLKGVAPFINAGIECNKLFGGEHFRP
jgi:unsaturated rhamnogalacturonyl hydrolase